MLDFKTETFRRQGKLPYLHRYFNVSAWYKNQLQDLDNPSVGRIHNSLIDALNVNNHLPKYIVVIPDRDVLDSVNIWDYGARKEINEHICWLLKRISRSLMSRREDLIKKCPGSVDDLNPTRVVWIKMLTRPMTSDPELDKVW